MALTHSAASFRCAKRRASPYFLLPSPTFPSTALRSRTHCRSIRFSSRLNTSRPSLGPLTGECHAPCSKKVFRGCGKFDQPPHPPGSNSVGLCTARLFRLTFPLVIGISGELFDTAVAVLYADGNLSAKRYSCPALPRTIFPARTHKRVYCTLASEFAALLNFYDFSL